MEQQQCGRAAKPETKTNKSYNTWAMPTVAWALARSRASARPHSRSLTQTSSRDWCCTRVFLPQVPVSWCFLFWIPVKHPKGERQSYARAACWSSLAVYHQIFFPADVIDPNYAGPIRMMLTNLSDMTLHISKHDRVGSIVFERYAVPAPKLVESFRETGIGSGGFRSTGRAWLCINYIFYLACCKA